MEKAKRDSKGRIVSNKNNDSVDESKSNESNPDNKPGSNKKDDKPKFQKVFVGFYRNEGGKLYGLHPQALSSEESMINKIKITYGDVDMHIFSTDLPL